MRSGVGSLTLDSGEVLRVRYSIEQIVSGGTITIVGEIRRSSESTSLVGHGSRAGVGRW